MTFYKRVSISMSLLFFILALTLLLSAFLPFQVLKDLANSLVRDGDFSILRQENVGLFRVLLASLAVGFSSCAAVTHFHKWRELANFLKNTWGDFLTRLHAGSWSKKNWIWIPALIGIMAIGIVYRLEYIFSSLHHDEAYTYMAFAHSLLTAVTDYHLPNNHVFHTILVFFSTRIFGNAPWAVRLPSFVAGILLIPAIYSLGKRHYNRIIGLSTGLLVAISPAMVGYSVNARGYTLVALFGVLLLNLGYQVHLSKDRFAWILIVLVASLGMFTVPAFLFPFGILFAWLFLEGIASVRPGYSARLDFFKYWLISGFCVAFCSLFLYLPIMIVSGADAVFLNQFVTPVAWNGFLETLFQRLKETWAEWTFRVPGWVIIMGIVGFVLSLAFHRKLSIIRVPTQMAAAAWILFLLVIQRPNAWSKVWFFLLPLVILWSVAGIFGFTGLIARKWLPIPVLCFIAIFVFAGFRTGLLVSQLSELWSLQGDEESAVLFVKENKVTGDGLVVSPPDDAPVWYYAERQGLSSLLADQENASRWFVLVNPGESQTPESVMAERGPAEIDPITCSQLDEFGKLFVYLCQETP